MMGIDSGTDNAISKYKLYIANSSDVTCEIMCAVGDAKPL